jgi:UDP-N-acetylglucosamine 4,6-dehydratase
VGNILTTRQILLNRLAEAFSWLIDLPRIPRRALITVSDFILLSTAIWLAFSLRWGRAYWPDNGRVALVMIAAPVMGVICFHALGVYRTSTRFARPRDYTRLYGALMLSALALALVILLVVGTGDPGLVVPRSVVVMHALIAGVFVRTSRRAAAWLIEVVSGPMPGPPREKRPVVIYGAEDTGVQLLEALRQAGDYEPVGFIDDSPRRIGQHIGGLKVYREEKLQRLIERDGVKDVLLALPARLRAKRRAIIERLSALPVRVKTIPSIADIASDRISVTDLRPIDVHDLLGREPVPPDADLLARAIRGKCVMVTGAGGSIGSELTRQILHQSPKRLVLFELSEAALYDIETEIADGARQPDKLSVKNISGSEVVSVLGSVLDKALLRRTIESNGVQTIYHAAAYKHVPIVENNPVAGLRNNTFGTLALAEVATDLGVERVTLVSTDKAVRPTSVMGASKRLSELVFQAYAADSSVDTIFTMVRFGNVLDSSGSVVRRFRKQIEAGRPVTVTHRDVMRYFMSIPEAAALVIQASAMAKGGEVFVLDMGEPVKIEELARTMIRLMGREVLDADNPNGDIPIEYVGLRPGEKLFEELRIDERTAGTEHPGIRRNDEPYLEKAKLDIELAALEEAMRSGRADLIEAVLMRTVEGYRPEAPDMLLVRSDTWPAAPRTLH